MTIVINNRLLSMKKISKSKLKPVMLKIFRDIEKTGEELIVTDHGKPVLKIIPYREKPEDTLGILKDSVIKYDDPTGPVGLDDWDLVK